MNAVNLPFFGDNPDLKKLPRPDRSLPDASLLSQVFLDEPYASISKSQKLDVYICLNGRKPCPVVIWLHEGGWCLGDKRDDISRFASPLLANGYAVISANYRLSTEVCFPGQIHDVKTVIRWVRANARKYGFDSDRIIVAGGSAGGHLAALAGTSVGVRELEDLKLGYSDFPSGVSAVIDWYGPVDFLKLDEHHKVLGQASYHNDPNSPESLLLGGQINRVPEICKMASPLTYISSDCPPFYIQHGKADTMVPYLQSVELAETIRHKAGKDRVVLELVEGAGHFDPVHRSPEYMEKVINFLKRIW